MGFRIERGIVVVLGAIAIAGGGAGCGGTAVETGGPAMERQYIDGAGVSFLGPHEATWAIVTHGADSHCVAGEGAPAGRRRVLCDDGLELLITGGATGECVASGDVAPTEKSVSCALLVD